LVDLLETQHVAAHPSTFPLSPLGPLSFLLSVARTPVVRPGPWRHGATTACDVGGVRSGSNPVRRRGGRQPACSGGDNLRTTSSIQSLFKPTGTTIDSMKSSRSTSASTSLVWVDRCA